MEKLDYYSSHLYGVDNDCIASSNDYDVTIDSINGEIGLILCCDDGVEYYDVYLNGDYVCEAETTYTDSEIEDLVEDKLFRCRI